MQTIEIMEKTFDSESNDIALYLAMSRKAEDEGYHEIASYLLNVAVDEGIMPLRLQPCWVRSRIPGRIL